MTTIISFYTNDWTYPAHAERLKKECDAIGINSLIEELPTTGSYLKNTCMKPQFILDKLNEIKSPVLWVDVDGSIYKKPELIDMLDCDFAAKRMSAERSRTWHVGTMWFNYTPRMIHFLESWIKNIGVISDESALEKTWSEMSGLISTYDLPPEYFHIIRRTREIPKDTVIAHRISDGESKKLELPEAIERAKRGEW